MKNLTHLLCRMLLAGALLSTGVIDAKAGAFNPVTPAEKERTLNEWELPAPLKDVSGIKYLGNNRFACIQDVTGAIFIYNANEDRIEKEIPFSEPGDFEGIAIAGTAAYVVQSNGKLFEIQDYEGANPVVKQYSTPLTAKHNVEGLTYDKKNDRLLLVLKDSELRNSNYKGIYAFDLRSKRLAVKPVVKINLADPFLNYTKVKDSSVFQPTAIEIHPITNDIYILQSTDPRLVVVDAKGQIKKLYSFSAEQLPQAEGLAFTPEGHLYVSNEGTSGAATIVKLTL
jgi:uncharacterized protein YjiK